MRRIIRLSVSVALVGVWLATAIPAQAATPAAAAKAKTTSKIRKAGPVKLARISTPKVARPNLPARAQWWKHVKPSVKRKPAIAPVLTLGVDAVTPLGHNWEYTAFFPEGEPVGSLSVPTGSVIDFHWNPAASLDSLHTVTFLHAGETEAQFRAANPFIVPDNAGGETGETPIQNNTIFNQTFPGGVPCGFVALGALPCVWDNTAGTGDVNSGAIPNNPSSGAPSDFQVQINAPAGDYTWICAIHANMRGTIHVTTGGTATSQAAADAAAAAQYNTLTANAAPVERADLTPAAPVVNGNGTKTWTQLLGDEVDDVELLEMLPPTLPITKGDSVKFLNRTTQEIHTVSFATNATFQSVLPFGPPQCEGVPATAPDTAAAPNAPPFAACTPSNAYEAGLNPAPLGEQTTITSGSTTGSSGILPPTASHTYTFPSNGTFGYFCFIHAGMFGAVYTPHYRQTATDGGEFDFGGADYFGSEGNITLNKPVVGQAETSDAQGYWQVASDGGVFTHGDAGYFGSKGGQHLNQPIVGITPTPDGGGYTMVASDGGVFTFGDAQYFGGMGGQHLNKPIVGIASTPDGGGYWEVASDGGVFNFGDAGYFGSLGGIHLNKPIVGVTSASFGGYTMVASDGGVFNFGDAGFFGSMGGAHLNQPIVGIALTIDGGGYREVASDGGIFTFGDAGYFGSMGGTHLNKPIVGLTAA